MVEGLDANENALRLSGALDAAGITYAIGGALAYGVWSAPRGTHDVDLNIEGRRILVSSKRHLILAKSSVTPPRKVDLRDIEDLEELLRGPG